MRLPSTAVGVDPSGDRIVAVAVRTGVFGETRLAAGPFSASLPANSARREEEAASLLAGFVRDKGLSGLPAFLCVPAERTFYAVFPFPRVSGKDAGRAVAMEAFRVLPLPEDSPLLYRHLGTGHHSRVAVAAADRAYVDRWVRVVAEAGLAPARAVPSGLAVAAFLRSAGLGSPHALVFRDAGGFTEHAVLADGFPVFCSTRPAVPSREESASAAAADASADPVPGLLGPTVYAPAGWADLAGHPEETRRVDFPEVASCGHAESGAFGAAVSGPDSDLLRTASGSYLQVASRALRILLVAVTVLLLMAWPATVAWKTRQEASMLKKAVADLRPAADRAEEISDDIASAQERISLVAAVGAERNMPLAVLSDLTERVPQNAWLTGLRMDGLKVEMDGFSPAAGDLFSALSRDGRFTKVEFAAPLTRQGDNLERFQIRAVYVPEGVAPAKEPVR